MKSRTHVFSISIFITLIISGCSCRIYAQITQTFEAEMAILSGDANIAACNQASGGQMVRGIHQGRTNALEFQEITLPESGVYFITLSYLYISDRDFSYEINAGVAKQHPVKASGAWCFEGGHTADFIFQNSFGAGLNSLLFYDSPIIDKIRISSDTSDRSPSTFYLSSTLGKDTNDGLSSDTPWASFSKLNGLSMVPGDSILFQRGDKFMGRFSIRNEEGTMERPITISSYGQGQKPILNGNGFLSTIHVQNSSHIHICGLEITNDTHESQEGEPTNLRYGIFFENTYSDGTLFQDFRIQDLTFSNIYPTEQITDDDQTGVNAYGINTSGSWMDEIHPFRFEDMVIENCFFTRTGRHATVFRAVHNLEIRNNLFEHVGGAGMVIGNHCVDILVENNITNYTGSKIDNRMAGRGSGIWAFRTKNLVVQHNKFKHARGIKDSFGMHIDIGNRNAVYQYNYSEDNEGGFVEILGANVDVGYRYNLSIGDGWRSRGNQLGRVFWIGGWSGNPGHPIGSDSVYIYNNSIFIPDTFKPRIWIEAVTKHTRIYNNIIYAANGMEEVFIKNPSSMNDFDHNIWFGDIPITDSDGEGYRGEHTRTDEPLFSMLPISDEDDFILQNNSPALANGKLIYNPGSKDNFSNLGPLDYYGNAVSTTILPNIGAYNGPGIIVTGTEENTSSFRLFPTKLKTGQLINIEIPKNYEVQLCSVRVLDSAGKVLFQKKIQGYHRIQVPTGELTQGLYFISVTTKSTQIIKRILVF